MVGCQPALITHKRSAERGVVIHERATADDGGTGEIPQPAAQRGEAKHSYSVPIADG